MSDSWAFSSSSPSHIHHSSQSDFGVASSPPLSSVSTFKHHEDHPHHKVTSNHLPGLQEAFPQLCHPQKSSPYLASPHHCHSQVTSPHLHHSQVTSPQLHYSLETSPQLPYTHVVSPQLPHSQLNSLPLASPHFTNPQVNSYQYVPQSHVASSYNLPQCQGTMPYPLCPSIASPDFVPQPLVTSPNLPPQCQISPHLPPQNAFPNQSHNVGLDQSNWNRSEPSPELSGFPSSYSYSYQIQTTAHLDLQNHELSAAMTHQKDTEAPHTLPCDNHTFINSSLYSKVDTYGPVQDWEPLDPTLSRMQCSPLGSISGGGTMERWNSLEFSTSSTEDFSNTQFYSDGYHDNNVSQSFCSPITPDPHYPQTPTISSPGPQMHPRKERLGVPTQTSTHSNTRSCLHECNSCPVTSEPCHHQSHETSSCLIATKAEPDQDQVCFSAQGRGQGASRASARLTWKGERGGRGRKAGGGGNGQAGSAWVKQSRCKNSTEAPGIRLQCTVCKRDFRSLPALNGHMRSHSGIRATTCLKKSKDSSPSAPPAISMVLPVSVPVQSRGASKMCRSGQRRCSHLASANAGTGLFRSLMRLKEEEQVTSSNKAAGDNGEDGHYTPPPMLCPHRVGPGLFCSLATRQQRVQTVQQDELQEPGATRKPRINVGLSFQAPIPPVRDQKHAHCDSHNALLLWTPWDKLEGPANQERVEAFVTMTQSSVMPRGAVNPEYALHMLSESRGDFLLTVEKLLSTPEAPNSHTGWSASERRQLVKSLQQHHKDFSSIQRDVQTKSISQCVEFYYLWKKKMSLTVKIPVGLTITLPNTGQRSVGKPNQSINECMMKSRTGLELHTTQ